jgi:hypothetical protein
MAAGSSHYTLVRRESVVAVALRGVCSVRHLASGVLWVADVLRGCALSYNVLAGVAASLFQTRFVVLEVVGIPRLAVARKLIHAVDTVSAVLAGQVGAVVDVFLASMSFPSGLASALKLMTFR